MTNRDQYDLFKMLSEYKGKQKKSDLKLGDRKYMMADVPVSARTSTFYAGNIIFKKGEKSNVMYEVLKGKVGIYLHYGEKNQVLLDTRTEGDFFGEIALLEKRPRTATAVALEDGTTLEETTSSEGFVSYVRKHPQNLEIIIDMMSCRFKEQRKAYLQACADFVSYRDSVENGAALDEETKKRIEKYMADATRGKN